MNRRLARSPAQHAGPPAWLQGIVLALTLVYGVVFFAVDQARWYALLWIVRPDALVQEWVGGSLARLGLLDRVPILGTTLLILAAALVAGRWTIEWLGVDRLFTRGEQWVLSAAVGLNLISTLALAAGLAGWLRHPAAGYLVLGAILGTGIRPWRRWQQRAAPVPAGASAESSWLTPRTAWMALPFALIILLGALLPPWHFDVREYHLQVPKEWYLAGRIDFLPHNVYGNMPLGAEMHALVGMVLWQSWWEGALVGKTMMGVYAMLAAAALFVCGRRFVSPLVGALAAVFFLATPWVSRVAQAGLNEGASALYYLLAGHVALVLVQQKVRRRSVDEDADEDAAATGAPGIGLAALAGYLSGSAVACKYPALLFLVVPVGLVAAGLPRRLNFRTAGVFLLAVACASGLWFGKNWVQSGNPTYPLLYEVFGGRTRTPEKHAQWSRAHRTPTGGLSASGLVHSTLDLTLYSRFLSPLLVPFALLALAVRRHRRVVVYGVAWLGFAFAGWWLLTHRVDRFLFPLLPLAALLAAIGICWSPARWWQRTVLGWICFVLVFQFLLGASRLTVDNRYLVAYRELREDLPGRGGSDFAHLHLSHHFLNQQVQPGYRALLVGEAQPFNVRVPALYNTCFDTCQFERLLKGKTRSEQAATLRQHRISHILILWRELDRYREPGNYGYSDYVTRQLVREQLVPDGLLKPIHFNENLDAYEVFEVVGWEQWETRDAAPDPARPGDSS